MRGLTFRDPRAMAGGVLLAGCLSAGLAPAVTGAEGPACSRYAVLGIAPGMRPSDVRARMGKGGAVEFVQGASGPRTSVTYSTGDIPVYVLYDRDISKDSGARVVLVRARARANAVNPTEFVRSIVPGLGEPVQGSEHLEDGFRNGATVWEDGECGVEVTAFRKEADWWQPGQDYLFVQIEPSDIAHTTASRTGAPPVSQPGGDAPATAPSEPPEERVGVPEAAAAAPPVSAPDSSSELVVGPTRIEASYVPPRYPERAQRMSIQASVVLEVQVRSDGSVGEVEVLKATRKGMGFEQAAMDAVKQWRYHPATRGGRAEDSVITVRIDFK